MPPLCVDLDGTLIRSDLLYESFARLLRHRPWLLPLVPVWLLRGRASLKRNLAERVSVDVASLPYHAELVAWLRQQRGERPILLVTAADERFAREVAAHVGLFDRVIASDGKRNLKGRNKLDCLRAEFASGFDYAGNDWSDLEIWRHSANAVAVDAPPALLARLREVAPDAIVFESARGRWKAWLQALAIPRWWENLLVFAPLLTGRFAAALPAVFAGFCLCSSAQSIWSELACLEADRGDTSRRTRPFASGDLSIVQGLAVAVALAAAGLTVTAFSSLKAAGVLAAFVAIAFAIPSGGALRRLVLLVVRVLGGFAA